MKFKLTTTRTAVMPVSCHLPTESGGKWQLNMKVTFEILPDSEFRRILGLDPDESEGGGIAARLASATKNHDPEILRRTVRDWSSADLVDADGQPVPFSAGALETIIEHVVPLRAAMAAAYLAAHTGEGARKN